MISSNWRDAPLTDVDKAFCAYAEKLTLTPSEVSAADLDELRQFELDDRAIHDAAQVIGYFNYINRIADSLGVEPETFVRPWEQPLE